MPDRQAGESPDEQVIRYALEKLRARDGVTVPRLRAAATEAAAPLLRLRSVRRYANVHGVDLVVAARDIVADCVRTELAGTDQIVADAVLGTGVFTAEYARGGIEPRVVEGLCSGMLSRRRSCLLGNWQRLHRALAVSVCDPPPSDRSLRGPVEVQVLATMARLLVRRDRLSLGSSNAAAPDHEGQAQDPGPGVSGRVVVVGAAVMDAVFQTKALPQIDTSSEAFGFALTPGGKGLNQAVAAARLGLDVSLIAAVTDDRFGDEITSYLAREQVDTSLLKHVRDAKTPFTGIIELELGDSVAVNWRNDHEVRLDVGEIENSAAVMCDCDAVLMTFEVPRESLQHALGILQETEQASRRPHVIVTPAQPYADGTITGQALGRIDYLVARAWELGRLVPARPGKFDVDVTARQLLAMGVDTLCIPAGGGCTIFSEDLGTFTVPTFPSQYKESSAARDAFCAALAAKLIESGGFSEEVALWATAAMAATTADFPLPNPMPGRQRISQLLARSRFLVSPNSGSGTGLSDAAAE
ncbi:MAG TPA: PfkB family carbohydrate kinase [Streptosporangiaceae bacterium]